MQNKKWLRQVAADLQPGDLLLFKGQGWISRLIGSAGRSDYSHCGKVEFIGGTVFCAEVREFKGGRLVTLASQIKKYPGKIDVYETNPNAAHVFDRGGSVDYMRRFAGQDYGWKAVWNAALQHLPFVRLLFKHDYRLENGDVPTSPPFCSQACAMADHYGGSHDPVPNLADRFTLPGDLARSDFYKYQCTLMGV